ncbi:MAG: NUDIX hydrolase [bacterium]|nr:NUDIX hydrolase [bacterium]
MMSKVERWEELSREEVFQKYGRGIEKRVYRLPHGGEADFYLASGHDSIACLALTRDQKIILVRQFRPGPAQVLLEMPGGGALPEEGLQAAIERELLEETGYKGKAEFIGSVLPSAYATYQKNIFVITECEKVAEPKLEDNGEVVEAVLLPLDEFRALLRSGQMTDVELGYLALDHLNLL